MIYKFVIGLFAVLFLATANANAKTKELNGRIDDVINGDTVIVQDTNNKRHKVYLLGIDAPEMDQDFGKQSKAYLDKLLLARNYQVKVIITRHTRAGDIVGTVFATELNSKQYSNINGMMVMSGHAWANPRTSKQYIAVEKIARNRKVGLWRQTKPMAPWKWRQRHKRK